ncbi:MAG TPA: nuclear transport factor 2 family protein [Pseudonocardiaceae bacterium]|nr:nuclear transport factor 2 family protein [Pseudonocardiaceae bacterium]
MATPTEIFHRLLTGITEGRFTELADLYAEDAVVELPFARPAPVRLVGREALRAHFDAPLPDGFKLVASDVVVRTTDDPEVVVAEWNYTVNGNGPLANVQIMRVRDGLIVATRDFHDHAGLASLASPAASAG